MKRSWKKQVLYIQVSWTLLLKTFKKYFYHQVYIITQFLIIKRFLHRVWNIPIIQGPAGSMIFWNHMFSIRERFSMTPFCSSTPTCTRSCNPKCPQQPCAFRLESPDLMWCKTYLWEGFFYCGSQFAKISELSNLWRSCCPAQSGTN